LNTRLLLKVLPPRAPLKHFSFSITLSASPQALFDCGASPIRVIKADWRKASLAKTKVVLFCPEDLVSWKVRSLRLGIEIGRIKVEHHSSYVNYRVIKAIFVVVGKEFSLSSPLRGDQERSVLSVSSRVKAESASLGNYILALCNLV
jgi:hypothetical protein